MIRSATTMKLRHLLATVLVLVLGLPAYAQFGLHQDKDKEKNKEAAAESDTPPEFSAKDKEKMEELAQKPEIKDAIDKEWEDTRREDMEVAYAVNTRGRDRLINSGNDTHSADYE